MINTQRTRILTALGAVLSLGGGPAAAHYVTGVHADPSSPVAGESVTLTVKGESL